MPCCWICTGCAEMMGCDIKEACCGDKCVFYKEDKCTLAEKMNKVLA